MRSSYKFQLPDGHPGVLGGLFFGLFLLAATPLAAALIMLSPALPAGDDVGVQPAQALPSVTTVQPARPVDPSSFASLSQPMNVLFMGTDVVYGRKNRGTSADPSSYHGNSDTMMLIRLDPLQKKINVLQIPRDTRVRIAGYGRHKINAANPLGGPPLAEQTVSSFLNEPVDHFLVMNVRGIADVVNELGGITVDVPKPMRYMDWTAKLRIDLTPGWHTLTGNQSMGFVRFRHDALGDIGRVQRQQIFMGALLKKVLNPLNWTHVPALLSLAQRNIQTDLDPGQMLRIANFVHSIPRQDIHFVMLPGRFAGNGDWLVDQDEAQTFVARLDGKPADDNFQDQQATTNTSDAIPPAAPDYEPDDE